ncbi:hypothetical protein [Primorskyibacter sp. S187A]|uniref:hypothetical protein n=1 Tax=Primorskyibacter sp. S187A TaxID=3415130 RepID=UPI003C797D00
MSDSDSFIEEVTEEVRRDRLFALIKRYGWIAASAILLLVGGASFNEYRKAQEQAKAQRLGDAMLAALENNDIAARAAALDAIEAETPGGAAILALLASSQETEAGQGAQASERLQVIATNSDLPEIYRNIAGYKALLAGSDTLSVDERRAGFQGLAVPGNPLRLLAEEQLALLSLETGAVDEALGQFNRIVEDAEASEGVRRRAAQMIVALGGEAPET